MHSLSFYPLQAILFYFDLYNRKPGSNFGGDNFIVRAEGVFLSCRVPIPKYIYKKTMGPTSHHKAQQYTPQWNLIAKENIEENMLFQDIYSYNKGGFHWDKCLSVSLYCLSKIDVAFKVGYEQYRLARV